MCVSCGCGDPDTRHIAGDIVLEDLVQAARNHEIPVDQVIANIDAMRGRLPGNGSQTGQGATQTRGAGE